MKFLSTRNKNNKKTFSEALIKGISEEGGLFVPENFPVLSPELTDKLRDADYCGRAAMILGLFADELGAEKIESIVEAGYGGKFDEDEPAPLLKLDDGLFFLELFHGPTLAFKDLALQLLPHLLAEAKTVTGQKSRTLILTATSGDTGKAAMDAFKDAENTGILVFYPAGGVSKMQRLQMTTQEGGNISVAAVEGNFDDCQRAVKEVMSDKAFIAQAEKAGAVFGSANSINIGRLLPQIVYYFSSYADMLNSGEIKKGQKINFAVPTGNFGDILAGFYAKQMGLPINKLICASNTNNILTDFFTTGVYDTRREFHKTISPSMDILVSSNLERLIFELSGRDDKKTSELFETLKTEGIYKIDEEWRKAAEKDFFAWYADEETTKKTIESFFDEYDYLLDPHTATAVAANEKYRRMTFDETPSVIVATAHPYKFASAVYEAVMDIAESDNFRAAAELEDISAIEIPESIAALKSKKILHTKTVKKENIKDTVSDFISGKK